MAKTLSVTASIGFSGTYTNALDNNTATHAIASPWSNVIANGVGANQADIWFDDARSISGAETLDLTADLSDVYGATLALVEIVFIGVRNRSTTEAEKLVLSGNAIEAFCGGTSPTILVDAGAIWFQSSPITGFTITNTTQDQFTITPASGTITYDLMIAGRLS
jgi:ABC-type Fe3+-siderophore transport system permease subunit